MAFTSGPAMPAHAHTRLHQVEFFFLKAHFEYLLKYIPQHSTTHYLVTNTILPYGRTGLGRCASVYARTSTTWSWALDDLCGMAQRSWLEWHLPTVLFAGLRALEKVAVVRIALWNKCLPYFCRSGLLSPGPFLWSVAHAVRH